MMNLNMFRVLTPDEEAAMQQYLDLETWKLRCRAIGATPEQVETFERSAQAFARTTVYPNSRIIATARQAAQEALLRGEPMPADAERALLEKWARIMAWMLGAR